jgi:hypothetical protein
MWTVRRRDGRRTYSFLPPQSDDPSVDTIVGMAEEATAQREDGSAALEELRGLIEHSRGSAPDASEGRDTDGSVPALEPIRLWASRAVEAVSGASERVALREFNGGLGLVEDGELSSCAWHGDTVTLVPVARSTTSVRLIYTPSREERDRRDLFRDHYAKGFDVDPWWPWPELQMSADILGFVSVGEIGSAFAEFAPRSSGFPRRYVFQFEPASKAAGFVIVKPLYKLARHLRVRARDPLWPARVRRAEQGDTNVPPRLEDKQPSTGPLIVLVHGLASTAAEMAQMLAPLRLSAARFEHDTFISIDKNASDLARLIHARAESAERIILLCHSRGGLVARAAADLLPKELAARTAIHTFGTPHKGTALAEFAPIVPLIHLADLLRHPSDVVRAANRYLLASHVADTGGDRRDESGSSVHRSNGPRCPQTTRPARLLGRRVSG